MVAKTSIPEYTGFMKLLPLVHTLAASVPEALVIIDSAGEVLECNQRATLLLGAVKKGTAIGTFLPGLDCTREGITRVVVNGVPLLSTLNHQGAYTIISFSMAESDGVRHSRLGKHMEDLHNISMELAKLHSLGALYRTAVEEGKKCLGVKYMAILLHDPDFNEICGTWGTDTEGTVVDQSSYRAPLSSEGGELFDRLKASRLVSEWGKDSPAGHNHNEESPWANLAPLWDGNQITGWIAAGNALPSSALDESQRELLLVYARTISSLVSSKRHEEELEAVVALKTLELQKSESHFRELSEALQHRKEDIEQLFTIMAHDLRGPLGMLRNIIVTAVDNSQLLGPEDIIELLPDMRESVDATYSLLDNLLNWVRSQMNEITVLEEWCSLDLVFKSIHQWLDRVAMNKRITIKTFAEPALMVHADQRMLETILRNLVSNAIKFSPSDSTVELAASRSQDTGHMILQVKDNGVGMTREQQASLFVMKENRINPGTNGEKGSGLGLMFSRDLANRMGGDIRVESAPGKGSTFFLDLPDKVEEELPPV